jgi:iron-sulfur cluster repair protein YtfE (RIC family)
MSFTLDYGEPIPRVVERLISEHKELEKKLSKIEEVSRNGDVKVAINLLNDITAQILRHAVEEEARLMRVIMRESKQQSEQSISTMRQHVNITNFLKHRLPNLATLPDSVARREIRIFVNDLRKHHAEEERIVFPLALEADGLNEKMLDEEVRKHFAMEYSDDRCPFCGSRIDPLGLCACGSATGTPESRY